LDDTEAFILNRKVEKKFPEEYTQLAFFRIMKEAGFEFKGTLTKLPDIDWDKEVDDLDSTSRGEGGFGSTGLE